MGQVKKERKGHTNEQLDNLVTRQVERHGLVWRCILWNGGGLRDVDLIICENVIHNDPFVSIREHMKIDTSGPSRWVYCFGKRFTIEERCHDGGQVPGRLVKAVLRIFRYVGGIGEECLFTEGEKPQNFLGYKQRRNLSCQKVLLALKFEAFLSFTQGSGMGVGKADSSLGYDIKFNLTSVDSSFRRERKKSNTHNLLFLVHFLFLVLSVRDKIHLASNRRLRKLRVVGRNILSKNL